MHDIQPHNRRTRNGSVFLELPQHHSHLRTHKNQLQIVECQGMNPSQNQQMPSAGKTKREAIKEHPV